MHRPDRVYFSKFAVDPEFESMYEYDDLYGSGFDGYSNHFLDETDFDDSDELNWDSI